MIEPTILDRAIILSVVEPLDNLQRKSWLKVVREAAPKGVTSTLQMVDDENNPQIVAMVAQESKIGHAYSIPLTRDLLDREVELIVERYATDNPDIDFQISTTAVKHEIQNDNKVSVDADRHLQMCLAFAKTKHEDWMRERSKSGWRYGTRFSISDKTHPLLRPWHELPDEFRKPDLSWPETMMKMMSDQGYSVVSNDDLQRVSKILQNLS